MRTYRLRTDLKRVVIDGFALPLGFVPVPGNLKPPIQGYTVAYNQGQDDEPDTYCFYIVVSHERIAPLLHRAFELLPDQVCAIVEIGSRDAYRTTDVYMSAEGDSVSKADFLRVWNRYEPFFLEDGSIAAGANSEEPFVEVFLDQRKAISLHVPTSMREEAEALLSSFGLEEVPQTWPVSDDGGDEGDLLDTAEVRPILDLSDEDAFDIDELLFDLRHEWHLELNIDPETNIDDGGRELGSTLWHAVVIVESTQTPGTGAYAYFWATAASMSEMENLIHATLEQYPEWAFGNIYIIDRVAYDERPDELAHLSPTRGPSEVHRVMIEPWDTAAAQRPPRESAEDEGKGKGW